MRIAFFGTAEFSQSILKALLENFCEDVEVVCVVSQEDKPVGRDKIMTKTSVKIEAEKQNLPIFQPHKLRGNHDFFEILKSYALDFIVVVAYGKIIPQELLEIPKYGCINIHGSILPKYRGASPIQEAIKNGDPQTGITIMYMNAKMDEGDILSLQHVPIELTDTTLDIFEKFSQLAPQQLVQTLKHIQNNALSALPQYHHLATYCAKIEKKDGEIDVSQKTAKSIYNTFRAYTPWPGIYGFYKGKKFNIEDCFFDDTNLEDDEELKIGDVVELEDNGVREIGVICLQGILLLRKVKPEGKKTMSIFDFINGNKEFLEYNFVDEK